MAKKRLVRKTLFLRARFPVRRDECICICICSICTGTYTYTIFIYIHYVYIYIVCMLITLAHGTLCENWMINTWKNDQLLRRSQESSKVLVRKKKKRLKPPRNKARRVWVALPMETVSIPKIEMEPTPQAAHIGVFHRHKWGWKQQPWRFAQKKWCVGQHNWVALPEDSTKYQITDYCAFFAFKHVAGTTFLNCDHGMVAHLVAITQLAILKAGSPSLTNTQADVSGGHSSGLIKI